MNKKIKRMIAVALAISAFSIIEPTKYINLTNTLEVNAAVKGAELKKISLGTGSIDFKASKTEYTLTLKSSVEELRIGAPPKEEDAKVKINGTEVDDSDNYSKIVNLDKGENKVTIKVTNGSKNKLYTITVIRGEIKDEQIYLSDIKLSAGNINFSKETISYDVDVNSDVSKISVKAQPEDEDYDVEIDGVTVNDDDDYKKTVALVNGNNKIKVNIQDDDDHEKTYTLNVNRGGISTTTNTSATTVPINTSNNSTNVTPTTGSNTNTSISKGWISNNGQWIYFDESGKKQIGWKIVNGKWYYLDTDGIMKTGWQSINGQWYYLDSTGAMKTGWFKNLDNKWYYLYDSGVMAKNTTIGGYKLGSMGEWVK